MERDESISAGKKSECAECAECKATESLVFCELCDAYFCPQHGQTHEGKNPCPRCNKMICDEQWMTAAIPGLDRTGFCFHCWTALTIQALHRNSRDLVQRMEQVQIEDPSIPLPLAEATDFQSLIDKLARSCKW
jgi:hypothetical protein